MFFESSKSTSFIFSLAFVLLFIVAAFPHINIGIAYAVIILTCLIAIAEPLQGFLLLIATVIWPVGLNYQFPTFKLIAVACLVGALIGMVHGRLKLNLLSIEFFLIFFWLTIIVFGVIYGPESSTAYKYLGWASRGPIIFLLFPLLYVSFNRLNNIPKYLMLIGAIYTLIAIIHYVTGLTEEWMAIWGKTPFMEVPRIIPYGLEPNYVSATMISVVGVGLAQIEIAVDRRSKYGYILLTFISILGILFTYSRSGLLAVILTFAVFIIGSGKSIKYLAGAIVSAWCVFYLKPDLFDRVMTISDNLASEGASGRYVLWDWAISDWLENGWTFFFGLGTGGFVYRHNEAVHNTFMAILVDNGLFGFTVFTLLVLYCMYVSYMFIRSQEDYPSLVVMLGYLASLVGTIFMYMTISDVGGVSLSLLMVLICSYNRYYKKNEGFQLP